MNNKMTIVEDVEFVLAECLRFSRILQEGKLNDFPRVESLFSIPSPNGIGRIICGQAAAEKITVLAEIAPKRGKLSRRIKQSTFEEKIAELISSRFLKEKRLVDISQVDRLINTAIQRAGKECLTLTHLIPCHLLSAKDPERFAIGPVTFHNRKSIRQILRTKEKRNFSQSEGSEIDLNRRLLARSIRYYRNFQWMAEVEIENCDASISETIAEEAVTAALNCLHLLLGNQRTSRMRVGGLNIRSDQRAKLTITSENVLEPSLSTRGFGEVTYPNGWSSWLDTSDFKYWESLFFRRIGVCY